MGEMMEISALQQEFLDDHRILIAGLNKIIMALEGNQTAEAMRLAGELDRDAGAHMAFEEEVFYPQLAAVYGEEFVQQMLAEHEAGHRAIKSLVSLKESQELTDKERVGVLDDLGVALKHVMSCGTMLAELGSGKPEMDAQALDRLRELRERAGRWSRRSYGDG